LQDKKDSPIVNIDAFHHLETVRKLALQLPEVEEYTCTERVRGK
jgi:hypothetical protein